MSTNSWGDMCVDDYRRSKEGGGEEKISSVPQQKKENGARLVLEAKLFLSFRSIDDLLL